jgi:hypothetical protein
MPRVEVDEEELDALRGLERMIRRGAPGSNGVVSEYLRCLDAIRARASHGELLPGAYESVCFDCQGTWIGKTQTPPAVVPICGRCGKPCTGGHWVLPRQAEGDLVPIGRPPSVTLTAEQAEQLIWPNQAGTACTCGRHALSLEPDPDCPLHGTRSHAKCTLAPRGEKR